MNYFSKQTLIDCNLFNSFQFHPIDTHFQNLIKMQDIIDDFVISKL